MTYRKINIPAELRAVEKAIRAGQAPCEVCQCGLMAVCAGAFLDVQKQEARRARRIRRARRVGNLVTFPRP